MSARKNTGKQNHKADKKLKDDIEKKAGKSVEELYEEREKRVRDAISLRESDRVPVVIGGGYFAAR